MPNLYNNALNTFLRGGNAQQFQQAAQSNALRNAMSVGMSQPGMSPALAARQAQQAAAQTSANTAAQAAQMRMQEQAQGAEMMFRQRQADQALAGQIVGGALNAAGAGMAMGMKSDERVKQNIQPAGRALDAFMRAADPASFQYREGIPEAGQRLHGVMAQDIESTPVGREMVQEDPNGIKTIDQNAALSTLLAAVARLNDRIDQMQGGGNR